MRDNFEIIENIFQRDVYMITGLTPVQSLNLLLVESEFRKSQIIKDKSTEYIIKF